MTRSDLGDAFDALVEDCGGYILGTSPRDAATAGGEWDHVREQLPRSTLRRLVLWGMAGKVRQAGAVMPAGLRGVPTDPSTLAWAIAERGHGPADMDSAQVVDWYVARCDEIAARSSIPAELDARPAPDALPAWVAQWCARTICDRKREFIADAARAVYWPDEWPTPAPTGATWEDKIWRKLGNRHVAEHARATATQEGN